MRFFVRLKTAAFKSVTFADFLAFFEKNKTEALSASCADKVTTPFLWFIFRIVFPRPETRDFLPMMIKLPRFIQQKMNVFIHERNLTGSVDTHSLARFRRGRPNLCKNKTSSSGGW